MEKTFFDEVNAYKESAQQLEKYGITDEIQSSNGKYTLKRSNIGRFGMITDHIKRVIEFRGSKVNRDTGYDLRSKKLILKGQSLENFCIASDVLLDKK